VEFLFFIGKGMTENDLKLWIKNCEGLRFNPYLDTTGHVTIGWGRNLDNGISLDEAEFMFKNDYERSLDELEQFDWYNEQPEKVKSALINMNFNLGIHKLLTFKRMIEALKEKNYTLASMEALDSKWARQVHQRAVDVATMIREVE
jgi:lysozyme